MSTSIARAEPRRLVRFTRARLIGLALVVLAALGSAAWHWRDVFDRGDERLAGYVHARPPVAVVFTSRTEPASLIAAPPEGEEFVYPGQPLWQAREGRLRLLKSGGTVHELTWGKLLPDGGTLVDVMSPSVTADGKRIVFAGRRGGDDPGHFRLYEIGVNGRGLRQITGNAGDPGCTAPPPMRYRSDDRQSLLPDAERQRIDYDDVDPVPLSGGAIAFISSRTPDLGRDHARRATDLWLYTADGGLRPLSANRNSNRWPFFTSTGLVLFSHWSRNREVISEDRRDIVPWEPGKESASVPTDAWAAMAIQPNGERFGHAVKAPIPVWRPRVLFNGKLVCMTRLEPADSDHADSGLRVVQMELGTVAHVPSALASNSLPLQKDVLYWSGPTHDRQNRPLDLATPAPCPPDKVLLAAGVAAENDQALRPGRWGIYIAGDDWSQANSSASSAPRASQLELLFDDPKLVDAEPVAVYERLEFEIQTEMPMREMLPESVELADGTQHTGPATYLENNGIFYGQDPEMASQLTDLGEGPIFDAPPEGLIESIRIYVSERDRFDDPQEPRIKGGFRKLQEMPLDEFGTLRLWVPTGNPTVLAGIDAKGQIAQWTTRPRDSQGNSATFHAFAGDHYSGGKPGAYNYCIGCHPGHNGIVNGPSRRDHAERLP